MLRGARHNLGSFGRHFDESAASRQAAAFVFSCTRRRCVGIVFFFSFSLCFLLLPPPPLTQPEHFSGAFLSASTLAHSPSVIFKCSHLSSAARRSIEAERKHGGMRLSCAPAVFARNKNNYFSLCLLSACCHPVWKPRASSERGGRQPEQHQHVARSSSRSPARF